MWTTGVATCLVLLFSLQNSIVECATAPVPDTAGPGGPIEILFSFDTTGSMSSVLGQVRGYVQDMIQRLQSDLPGIRIGVFAHGDHGDVYVTRFIDLTRDVTRLTDFVKKVPNTGGGDSPECYECVLKEARQNISWTPDSRRSLVMIGDTTPHTVQWYQSHPKTPAINWEHELNILAKEMGVRIYSIQALSHSDGKFWKRLATESGGFHLRLNSFSNIFDFIMAISYREYGLDLLKAYEEEVRERNEGKGMTPELQKMFNELKTSKPRARPQRSRPLKVITTPAPSRTTTPEPTPDPDAPKILSLNVRSDIAYRWATTLVTSTIENNVAYPREVTFQFQLPKSAFISNFTMLIDGDIVVGQVKEKEAAKRVYEKAKSAGKTAGHVRVTKPKKTDEFKLSVNVAANSSASFNLTYSELLERRLGLYNHEIHINPGQIIPDLTVDVYITESKKLTAVKVPPLLSEDMNTVSIVQQNPLATVKRTASNAATINYSLSPRQQKDMSARGVSGRFIVQYDVERGQDVGEVQVVDGYFVHYFSPEGLKPLNKNIMFILDTSGSMYGTKLTQMKDAMTTILSQLRPGDYFNVLGFSNFLRYWKNETMVLATKDNIHKASEFVKNLVAVGGTNINKAILKGVDLLNSLSKNDRPSMIVFLTDGTPTAGITKSSDITKNLQEANSDQYKIFTLGFGAEVDFTLLQKMALQNNGLARRIYADSDAALQLKGFYSTIADPLLSELKIDYLPLREAVDQEDLVTTQEIDTFYSGSELILAGRLKNNAISVFETSLQGQGSTGVLQYRSNTFLADGTAKYFKEPTGLDGRIKFTEKLWAYLTIKGILEKSLKTENATIKAELKKRALAMSLKYHFVTPLTSMVVVKPDEVTTVSPAGPQTTKSYYDGGTKSKVESTSLGSDDVVGEKRSFSHPGSHAGPSTGSSRSRSVDSKRPTPSRSFVDGDPHLLVFIKGLSKPVCYDIKGKTEKIYQLLYDPKIDLTVNAKEILRHHGNQTRSYFNAIAITYKDAKLVISTKEIKMGSKTVGWRHLHASLQHSRLYLEISQKKIVTITLDNGLVFDVYLHRIHFNSQHLKVNHLGFYIINGESLSKYADGLIGQFHHARAKILPPLTGKATDNNPATLILQDTRLNVETRKVLVRPGTRRNLLLDKKVPCWHVRNNGRNLLARVYTDYSVPYVSFSKANVVRT